MHSSTIVGRMGSDPGLATPEKGETATKTRAMGMSAIPALTGSSCPVACHVSGTRKRAPYIPNVIAPVAQTAPEKALMRNMSSGTSADAPRAASILTNPINDMAATPRAAVGRMAPPSWDWMVAKVRPPRASIART